jgi:putative ABC transport system substrate-binding protein
LTARRPVLTVILAIGLVGVWPAADAQQAVKIPRIGWLSIASRTPEVAHPLEAFSQGLRDLGYVEGQNVGIEYRFADGKLERQGVDPR